MSVAASPDPSVTLLPRALALIERVGGPPLLRELATLYAGYAPQRLADVRAAAASADADALRRACHALKSGSAQLGAQRVASLCAELESRGAAGEVADASAIAALETALGEALEALDAHTAGSATAGAAR